MFKDQSDFLKYFFIISDFLVALLSSFLAFALRFWILDQTDFNRFDVGAYLFFGLLLAFMQVVAFGIIDLYHPRRIAKLGEEIFSIVFGVTLNLLLSLSFLFFLHISDISRAMVGYFAIITVVLTASAHGLVRTVLRSRRTKGYNRRSVVILGTEYAGRKIWRIIQKNPIYGYQIVGFVREEPNLAAPEQTVLLGDMSDLAAIIDRHNPNIVIVALENPSAKTVELVLQVCDTHGCDLKLVPAYANLITAKGRVETMDGLPIISIREIPARGGLNRIIKRLFDIVFSLLFLLVFSPFFLIIALLVKLSSPGPVLFKQVRVGLDGRHFLMFKFRTMYLQDPKTSDTIWTKPGDKRVTGIGRFLRRTSLDEIPQFLNVLIGQMSIVGPRPERPFYVEQFKHQYHQYMRRHAVKSGVTGWAQINGLRGNTSIQERIEADFYYIENWSFLLDLWIVFVTPFKGLFSKDAY